MDGYKGLGYGQNTEDELGNVLKYYWSILYAECGFSTVLSHTYQPFMMDLLDEKHKIA